MANIRLIARLDIKAPNLVKGIHLEGLRVIGDPAGARAALLPRRAPTSCSTSTSVASLVRAQQPDRAGWSRPLGAIFVPLTVGGGTASIEDIHMACCPR